MSQFGLQGEDVVRFVFALVPRVSDREGRLLRLKVGPCDDFGGSQWHVRQASGHRILVKEPGHFITPRASLIKMYVKGRPASPSYIYKEGYGDIGFSVRPDGK